MLIDMVRSALVSAGPVRGLAPDRRVLVFDSGLGGLTVARAVRALLPDVRLDYLADDAGFPYGAWHEAALTERVVRVLGEAIEALAPDLVVIACHTASTLVLPPLRARHAVPFVGTVPAVKPAAAATRTGRVSVLATPGTVKRDYTRALIAEHAKGVAVTLVGATRLAAAAEARLAGEPVADALIAAEIAPAFVDDGGVRTDTVVLACTHYPLLLPDLERLAPWPVHWIDPAPAIARRVASLLGPAPDAGRRAVDRREPQPGTALCTSGRAPHPALRALVAGDNATLAPARPITI